MKENFIILETRKEEVERRNKAYNRFTNIFKNDDERNKNINLDFIDYNNLKRLVYSEEI